MTSINNLSEINSDTIHYSDRNDPTEKHNIFNLNSTSFRDEEPSNEQSNSIKPTKNYKVDSIVNSVINKFIERAKVGKEKYGTDLDRTDLALYEWILHAQEEHMDAILYLEKIKKIIVNNS
jgi:hypothetical protein